MIVDFHRHLWSVAERYPSVRIPGTVGGSLHSGAAGAPEPIPDLARRGAEIVAEMDAAGVDRSVIFLGDYGLRLGEGTFTVEAENRLTAELARGRPDRLIAFLGVDPRRPGGLELFRRGVEEWGLRGLKLHPATGFRPSDPACRPFFELAGRLGVPIACHTGPMASPMLSHTCQPIYLDEMAADYPETTIIMQHAGQQAWWREALNIAFWKPNVVLELSMWQWAYLQDQREFVAAIARMRDTIGIERILFASDLPGLRGAMPLRAWVEVFQDLPALAGQHGYRFDQAEVQALLGGNAARILGLAERP
jgi:predicted TIM-barrel fold metal-dependent hydrolase